MRTASKALEPFCKVHGCESLLYGIDGYCNKHSVRIRKYGDPLKVRPKGWAPGDPNNPSKKPARRAAISAWRSAVTQTEDTKRKIRDTMMRRMQQPGMRQKCREASLKKPPLSADARRKISAAHAKRPKKLSTLVHNADAAFSKYIRSSYMDGRGNISCFTCDSVKPMAEMDCGHFVGRQHRATRYFEKNAQPQCRYCNRYNEGRKDVYAVRLVEKYGPNILLELQEEKNKVVQLKASDYADLITIYKNKLKDLNG